MWTFKHILLFFLLSPLFLIVCTFFNLILQSYYILKIVLSAQTVHIIGYLSLNWKDHKAFTGTQDQFVIGWLSEPWVPESKLIQVLNYILSPLYLVSNKCLACFEWILQRNQYRLKIEATAQFHPRYLML